MPDNPKKPAMRSATWPFIMSLALAASFVALFYAFKSSAVSSFDETIAALPSVKLFGSGSADTVKGYFATYGALLGLLAGLLYVVIGYILLGIFALAKLTKMPFGVALCCLLTALPFAGFGYGLATQSARYTPIANGMVYFLGRPLMYAGLCVTVFAVILFVLSFKYGKDKNVA